MRQAQLIKASQARLWQHSDKACRFKSPQTTAKLNWQLQRKTPAPLAVIRAAGEHLMPGRRAAAAAPPQIP